MKTISSDPWKDSPVKANDDPDDPAAPPNGRRHFKPELWASIVDECREVIRQNKGATRGDAWPLTYAVLASLRANAETEKELFANGSPSEMLRATILKLMSLRDGVQRTFSNQQMKRRFHVR